MREIPQVMMEKMEFAEGYTKKVYQVVRSPAGTVTVHIHPAGRDLSLGGHYTFIGHQIGLCWAFWRRLRLGSLS